MRENMKIEPKSVIGVALIGAIGFAIYKFYKGDWKLPSLPSLPGLLSHVPGLPADIGITLGETGAPGAVGDVIYNILYPDNLREETTVPGSTYYDLSKTEIQTILPPGIIPQPEQIVPRAIAMKVSEDIHKTGLPLSMILAPITIASGLGAISQQEKYYATLPEDSRQKALQKTVLTRQTWKAEHPVEHMVATGLSSMFPPALIIGQAAELFDVARAGMLPWQSKPTPGVIRAAKPAPPPPKPPGLAVPVVPEPSEAPATQAILGMRRLAFGR